VAFEAKFDSFGVLCGPNGAGKSSVLDVLKLIRDLVTSEASLGGDGSQDIRQIEFTNWLKSTTQEFELGIRAEGRDFGYRIHIEQTYGDFTPRIIIESATCNGRQLFSRDLDGVTFARRDRTQSGFPLDWRQAALGAIQPTGALRDIEILQNALARILILRPSPRSMEAESRNEARQPFLYLSNILS